MCAEPASAVDDGRRREQLVLDDDAVVARVLVDDDLLGLRFRRPRRRTPRARAAATDQTASHLLVICMRPCYRPSPPGADGSSVAPGARNGAPAGAPRSNSALRAGLEVAHAAHVGHAAAGHAAGALLFGLVGNDRFRGEEERRDRGCVLQRRAGDRAAGRRGGRCWTGPTPEQSSVPSGSSARCRWPGHRRRPDRPVPGPERSGALDCVLAAGTPDPLRLRDQGRRPSAGCRDPGRRLAGRGRRHPAVHRGVSAGAAHPRSDHPAAGGRVGTRMSERIIGTLSPARPPGQWSLRDAPEGWRDEH